MEKKIRVSLILISSLFAICFLDSCLSSKKLTYFNNVTRDTTEQIDPQITVTKISKNDILQIAISSLDPQTAVLYNSNNTSSATGNSGMLNGYLVDDSGIIKIPLIGSIKAVGLSKAELADQIANEIVSKKIAIDPIVTVRFLNYKITVLGEVVRPGVIPVPNEHITLPEAIGMAGDLTAYAKRDNVLLIREVDGKRIYKRFNLNENQMFNKDIYYLQNQDIIYVEPGAAKATSADRTVQLLPIFLSAVSILVIIITQVFRK